MDIHQLLIQPLQPQTSGITTTTTSLPVPANKQPIHDDDLMIIWEKVLQESGYKFRQNSERNSLTDGFIWPSISSTPTTTTTTTTTINNNHPPNNTPIHIKVIGRHMNGSFRCHIGTGKASRPIQSNELYHQMRLLAVFFKAENSKSQLVSPEFIFFPTWLLHLFRYTEHGSTPGRTDVRFLENAMLAKEDHIYRLNNVLNTLFRFNLHDFDHTQLRHAVDLANYLFNHVGLEDPRLPRPEQYPSLHQQKQPMYYAQLISLLQAPRPSKLKPMCHNCNTKPASRRKLCVACYRYQLKHGEPRPLRLIVANRPGPRVHHHHHHHQQQQQKNLPMVFYSPPQKPMVAQKFCANCGVHETHQWYRNLCGTGHWCETCKSYYLRHTKVRPPELFVKAAKRKVDVRTLVNWWPEDSSSTSSSNTTSITHTTPPPYHNNHHYPHSHYNNNNNNTINTSSSSNSSTGSSSPSSITSSVLSSPTTPPATSSSLLYRLPPPCSSQPLYN
ncbi:hypothetical protein BDA99DRAFT_499988 [Phascolomyces articulosus]|uniref:GATA-type domain-containing protein n=1 Tax=Phascolomyces articulosus TaxID=60185 RepID=A0AAD5KK52_9FUNG|nr:hypothetical protein BDA99DRAFT_499988 [Phascolomyces articulosus]